MYSSSVFGNTAEVYQQCLPSHFAGNKIYLVHVTSSSVSTLCFHIETMLTLMAIKSNFKGPYDTFIQNLTLVVIVYEISESRRMLVL